MTVKQTRNYTCIHHSLKHIYKVKKTNFIIESKIIYIWSNY